MYINRVILENIKGFKSLDFSFIRPNGGSPAGWTVITGENASGKTALLKAIAIALVGPDFARVLQPSLQGWIRKACGEGEIAVQIKPHDADKFTAERRPETAFWSEIELRDAGGPELILKPGDRYRKKQKGPLNGPWAENSPGWFAVGYGPFRRLYGTSTEAQRLMSGKARIARFATLFKEDATLGECENWLKELNYKRLENKDLESQILDQILRLLNNDFLRNGIAVDRVDSDGLWLKDAEDNVLNLSDMSEGYRATLAMMVDIIRHLWNMFGPDLRIEENNGKMQIPHEGVVLIDEVDSHLHPEWQRNIGIWLKERFPKMQFIVTTHSALICQAADEQGIFHLPPPGSGESPFRLSEEDYAKIRRSKADEILLSPAFGLHHTRSPKAVEARQNYARYKAKERSIGLDPQEEKQMEQFSLFVEEPVEQE